MKTMLFLILILVQFSSFARPTLRHKIIAYYTGDGEGIKKYPVHQLTHIIYSFLHFRNDSLIFRNDKQKQILRDLVALKTQNPQLRKMGWWGKWFGG